MIDEHRIIVVDGGGDAVYRRSFGQTSAARLTSQPKSQLRLDVLPSSAMLFAKLSCACRPPKTTAVQDNSVLDAFEPNLVDAHGRQ